MNIWNDYLQWIVVALLSMLVVSYVTARISSSFGHVSKKLLVENLGPNSQLMFGGLGVIVHEFGHAAFAFVFGHHVTKVQLLNFHYAETGTLGSVEHSWNSHNIYQRLGNFFIGIAPYYTTSIAIFFLQKFMFGDNLNFYQLVENNQVLNVGSVENILRSIIGNFTNMFSDVSWPLFIIYLLISVMIASTGYDLSKEDFNTVHQGIIPWFVVVVIFASVLVILRETSILSVLMSVVTVFSLLFLVESILYIVISLIFIRLISIF